MRKIYLLKDYRESNAGDIIEVSNNIAFGLIDSGVGREPTNRDFLVKPEFGTSKAFGSSPSRPVAKRKGGGILRDK